MNNGINSKLNSGENSKLNSGENSKLNNGDINLKFYIAIFFMTIALIIAVGETMARYFVRENQLPLPPPISTIDPYSPNPYLMLMRPFMHSHIPNAHYTQSRSYYAVDYSINSSGFRGPEISPKSKQIKRAIIIGDSIVEGHGCEFKDTFSYKLGERARSFNWEVLNLGVQGASPSYFAANIDRYMATEPDAAIIVIFENDLYDDRGEEKTYFDKPILDNPEKLYPTHNKTFCLSDWSKLFMLLQRTSRKIRQSEIEKILMENSKITMNLHNKENNNLNNKERDNLNNEERDNLNNEAEDNLNKIAAWLVSPSMFDTQWQMSRKYLDYTTDAFTKKNIPIFIVYLSLGGIIPGQAKNYSVHANTFNHKVEEWSKSKNIPFLSLVPLLNELLSKVSIFDIMIKDDGHPTPKAHQIFADKIWTWLEKIGKPTTPYQPLLP